MSWVGEEFHDLDLGDKRREARAVPLAERTRRPRRQQACLGHALAGRRPRGYRQFRQETFNWLDLLEPHRACTRQRMAHHSVVLCLQDNTELDFNGQQIQSSGPLSDEAQRGMYLNPTLAVSP